MKRWLTAVMLVCALSLPLMTGCATTGGGRWQDNVQDIKQDLNITAKVTTRILLKESEMTQEDAVVLRAYLTAIKGFLSVEGMPNFDGARALANTQLPQQYLMYGLSIIDLIERYIQSIDFNIDEDQALIIDVINSCINGAIEAIDHYSE